MCSNSNSLWRQIFTITSSANKSWVPLLLAECFVQIFKNYLKIFSNKQCVYVGMYASNIFIYTHIHLNAHNSTFSVWIHKYICTCICVCVFLILILIYFYVCPSYIYIYIYLNKFVCCIVATAWEMMQRTCMVRVESIYKFGNKFCFSKKKGNEQCFVSWLFY